MRITWIIVILLLCTGLTACKKNNKLTAGQCPTIGPTIRKVVNKKATVKVTATVIPVYLVEEGTIDTKLIPCNMPPEFVQNDLEVIISGDVKATVQPAMAPCCAENIVLKSISK